MTDARNLTGTDDELDVLMEEADGPDLDKLQAWRDAAVAQHLAEAGAVHPKVHTPARIMQWLERHGWEPMAPVDPERLTAEWMDSEARSVFVPLHPNTVDYARHARYALERAAQAAGVMLRRVLAEVATLPDEWRW